MGFWGFGVLGFWGRLAGADGAEALDVGVTVEQEDSLDEGVRVLHLVDREVIEDLAQLGESPVVTHPGIEEVGVDDRQLQGQGLVEQLHHARTLRLHH